MTLSPVACYAASARAVTRRDLNARQVAQAAGSGDCSGLTPMIAAARRADTELVLWNMAGDEGIGQAAAYAGRMIFEGLDRSEVDTARIKAAQEFLHQVHGEHDNHAAVVRSIATGA